MEAFLSKVERLSRLINAIAAISLTFIMFLTVADVFLRSFRRPITGTYELVSFAAAVMVGFSLSFTSWARGHIYVDFLILKFSQAIRNIINIVTRCLGIFLFIMIGWNLIMYAVVLYKTREVSLTLNIPFYPIAIGVGICCFIQCLVLLCDILKIVRGKYE